MICSMEPFLSKSFTYNFNGLCLPAANFELSPKLPARISSNPSPFTSVTNKDCHNPVEALISDGLNFPLWFMKILIGIHSPVNIKSGQPSLFKSEKLAAVTMPMSSKLITDAVAGLKIPLPSLINK